MTSESEQINGAADWILRARPSYFALSAAAPLWTTVGRYETAAPLDVNIHAGLEVGIILSGRAERHFQEYVLPGIPGDVWLCAMWEPHGWRVRVAGTERVVLVFLPEFLGEEMLGELHWLSLFAAPPKHRPAVTTPAMRQKVLAIGREMEREIVGRQLGWETAVRIHLLHLLFLLGRNWRPPRGRKHPARRTSAEALTRIMPALLLLHTRNPEGVSLSEAAAACGLGRSQFSTVFHHTMGVSFGQFALRGRLAAAALLLLNTGLSAQAIARQTGFADPSHFHRAFVRHYGCTPGRYRTSRG
jgi:AraC-like DNA-binding protein